MNTEDKALLNEIILDVFEWDELPSVEELRMDKIEKWDSMLQLNLVSAIESEFDIVIDINDAVQVVSYEKAVEVIEKYL